MCLYLKPIEGGFYPLDLLCLVGIDIRGIKTASAIPIPISMATLNGNIHRDGPTADISWVSKDPLAKKARRKTQAMLTK
jgi:hypothetical protein